MCRELVFKLDSVTPPTGYAPLQTFDAAGRTLYVDSNHFEDKELLALLSPPNEYEMPTAMSSEVPAAKAEEKKDA